MTEPMIKGAVIREFVRWYAERFGQERLRQMAGELPPELAAHIDPEAPGAGILASSWYPTRLINGMLDVLTARHTDAEIERMAKDGSRYVVRQASTGIYRFLVESVVTPELYAMSVPRLWSQIHTTGKRRVEMIGKNEARSIVSSWAGHHPMLCMVTIATMGAIFESMGCRDVRWERTECVSHGGRQCVTHITWTR